MLVQVKRKWLNLQQHQWLWLVLKVAIAFFLFNLIFALHRYYSFYTNTDHAIFNQVFWNGIHGWFFQSSLSSSLSASVIQDGQVPSVFYHRLGQHFTPALLLWLPLYALFPSAATLNVLQVTLVTLAGLLLYALARQYLQPRLSAMITISFYAANAIIGPTLGNFFDLCQIPLYIFGMLLAMEKRRWWLFWVLVVLILAVREDTGVILFSIGFYLIVSKRHIQIGLALCSLSFIYMLLITSLVMPLFSQDISRRFMIERFGQFVSDQEASTLEIIWGIISNPWRLVVEAFSPVFKKAKYLLGQWLPLAFVPAISPSTWVIAGFPLAQLFLQQGDSRLAINIRYAVAVVPGLFYGAILWWSQHQELFKKRANRRFWVICISLSLFFTFTSNPHQAWFFLVPDSIQPWVYKPLTRQWAHVGQIHSLLAQIPADVSVAATRYILPQLSGRRAILRFPNNMQFRNDAKQVMPVDYVIADLWHEPLQASVALINQAASSKEYGVIDFRDGVVLMQKGAVAAPQAMASWLKFRQEFELEN